MSSEGPSSSATLADQTAAQTAQTGETSSSNGKQQTGAIFNKTRMCTFHFAGRCSKGVSCTFAHTKEELVPLPDLSCTKLCPVLFSKGSCEDGTCRFAHSRFERREFSPDSSNDGQNASNQQFNSAFPQAWYFGGEAFNEQETVPADVYSEGMIMPYPDALLWSSWGAAADTYDVQAEEATAFNPEVVSTTSESPKPGETEEVGDVDTSAVTTRLPADAKTASRQDGTKDGAGKSKFHKTKMCSFHLMGKCRKRGDCNFAHASDELQNPVEGQKMKSSLSPGGKGEQAQRQSRVNVELQAQRQNRVNVEVAVSPSSSLAQEKKTRGSNSSKGRDSTSSSRPSIKLPTLPSNSDLSTNVPEPPSPSNGSTPDQSPITDGSDVMTRKKFFKTKLCKFRAVGRCRKRHNCNFAHDERELNALPDLSRTKICPSLMNTGECGACDCRYAHDHAELRSKGIDIDEYFQDVETDGGLPLKDIWAEFTSSEDAQPDTVSSWTYQEITKNTIPVGITPLPSWAGFIPKKELHRETVQLPLPLPVAPEQMPTWSGFIPNQDLPWRSDSIDDKKLVSKMISSSPSMTTTATLTPSADSPSLSFEESLMPWDSSFTHVPLPKNLLRKNSGPADLMMNRDLEASEAWVEYEQLTHMLPSPVAAVRIKNTFLDVEVGQESGMGGLRSVRSAPDLFAVSL